MYFRVTRSASDSSRDRGEGNRIDVWERWKRGFRLTYRELRVVEIGKTRTCNAYGSFHLRRELHIRIPGGHHELLRNVETLQGKSCFLFDHELHASPSSRGGTEPLAGFPESFLNGLDQSPCPVSSRVSARRQCPPRGDVFPRKSVSIANWLRVPSDGFPPANAISAL